MEIELLAEAVTDNDGGVLTSVHWEDGALVLAIDCEVPRGVPRRFRLDCTDAVEVDIVPGLFEELDFATEHPRLLEHAGVHSQLFFSSSPASAGEVFLAAHEAIDGILKGSRDPQQVLCHRPAHFASVLQRGHGLLARGPSIVIDALAKRLEGMLEVNSIPSHVRGGTRVIVSCDAGFVICGSVSVTEIPT
jgi:hypothetical protein